MFQAEEGNRLEGSVDWARRAKTPGRGVGRALEMSGKPRKRQVNRPDLSRFVQRGQAGGSHAGGLAGRRIRSGGSAFASGAFAA
jgi:hypothetical protein